MLTNQKRAGFRVSSSSDPVLKLCMMSSPGVESLFKVREETASSGVECVSNPSFDMVKAKC